MDEEADWLRRAACPLSEDLSELKELIGDARVVALGESSHTAREQQLCKHQLLKLLVGELGFRLVALEESLGCCERIDGFIAGGQDSTRHGDAEDLLDALGLWQIHSTEEMLDLVRWMREFNQGATDRLRLGFQGIDIGLPLPSLHAALHALRNRRSRFAFGPWTTLAERVFDARDWMEILEAYRTLEPRELEVLSGSLQQLLHHVEDLGEPVLHQHARCALRAHEMFVEFVQGRFGEGVQLREFAMAENLRYLLERYPEERVVLLSHNGHVAKATRQVPDSRFLQPFVPLGARLAAELERDYVAVGFCCGYGKVREGIQPVTLPTVAADSLDARLAALGGPRFYLRLRDIPECPGSQWLHQPCAIRYELTVEWCRPGEAFDAVIFLESVSATQPIASALARLAAMSSA